MRALLPGRWIVPHRRGVSSFGEKGAGINRATGEVAREGISRMEKPGIPSLPSAGMIRIRFEGYLLIGDSQDRRPTPSE